MGAIGLVVDFTRAPQAPLAPTPSPDAPRALHALLVGAIESWMAANLGRSGLRVRTDYYASAVEYGTKHGMWGPEGERIELFFADFTGLESVAAALMHHWFTIALSLTAERLRPQVTELGLELRYRPRPIERIVTERTDSPFVELGVGGYGEGDLTEVYSLEWPVGAQVAEGERVLVSSEGVPRRSRASLSPTERERVERAALFRQCECRACVMLRAWLWERRYPWGKPYTPGFREGLALYERGDLRGARHMLVAGAVRGAPYVWPGYAYWIACTLAREGQRDEALRWLGLALRDGWVRSESLGEPDLAAVRGPELTALVERGPRERLLPRPGDPLADARAWGLLTAAPELAREARLLGEVLSADGAIDGYPEPLPPALFALMDALEARGARPTAARLVAMCEAAAFAARASRHDAVLPALSSRENANASANAKSHTRPWSHPLRLVVVGDLRGEIAASVLDRRPLTPIDVATFDAVRASYAPRDEPTVRALWENIHGLCAAVQASGRRDIQLEVLELPFQDVAEDFMAEGVLGSAFDELLVRRRLATFGETPVDACLLTWSTEASDQEYFAKLERILARGPVQAFGHMPSGATSESGLVVHADPFEAGRALVEAFAQSGYAERIAGLPEVVGTTFALARLLRHMASVHLATSPPGRTRASLEDELASWLATNVGDSGPLAAAAIALDEPSAGSRLVPCSLWGRLRGRAPSAVRATLFLTHALETSAHDVPSAEHIDASSKARDEALGEVMASMIEASRDEHCWDVRDVRTTLPCPDRWPITPDTHLWTYAFAYTSSPDGADLQVASRPFAAAVQRLDLGAPQLVRLTESIEELGYQGVFPIGPGVIERLQSFPPVDVLLAKAVAGPLDAHALEGLAVRYGFYRKCHGLAFGAALAGHGEFAAWLGARG